MRYRIVAVAALGISLSLGVAGIAPQAQAMAKIKCKQTTGSGPVDPIVHHNEKSGTAHMHQFFGNNSFLSLSNPNTANYATLLAGGTNCENTADTAGYWTPQLQYKATGKPVPVQAFTAYYRPFSGVGGADLGEGKVFPPDTRLIATDHDWGCGQFSGVGPQASVPSCVGFSGKPGLTLTSHVTFPNCWDGVLPKHLAGDVGDTNDNAHYRYKVRVKGSKTSTCPTGFPNRMVELRETTQYQYLGAGNDVELSSDMMANTSDGQSLHGDFWNTWQQAGFQHMVSNCVNPGGTFTATECG